MLRVCKYMCIRKRESACTCVHTHVCMYIQYIHVVTHVCIHLYIHEVFVCTYVVCACKRETKRWKLRERSFMERGRERGNVCVCLRVCECVYLSVHPSNVCIYTHVKHAHTITQIHQDTIKRLDRTD